MPSFTVRLTTGFLQVGWLRFFGFGLHSHLSSSSFGVGCGATWLEKPSIVELSGVKPGVASGAGDAVWP
jgi:hypothetical protein